MKKIIALMAQAALAIILASCAAKKGTFDEVVLSPGQNSAVYIYRPYSMSNILVSPTMLIDGKQKFKIDNNSYRYMILDHQGEHVFEIKVAERYSGVHQLSLNIEQGETIFLRVSTLLKFAEKQSYRRSFTIEQIDRKIAIDEIRETHDATEQHMKKNNSTKNKNLDSGEIDLNDKVPEDQFSISRTRNPFDK